MASCQTAAALAEGVHTLPGSRVSGRPRVSFGEAADLRDQLGERFDGLPLAQRQQLVRALVDVTVMLGRDTTRFVIENRATSGVEVLAYR
ncbi:hypothetical protein [Modestobacter sp. VKM Ac-2978]|uniref:hypothetical protein n=1 Tax=Modestobacter sp. VKM Ac-2978 TaxID=3004132 RepID=UPI0022AA05ED|nr:hypothetical protein [Modestobacter sp. VKM Ac-2978]MCZ2848085.1 hypothetical protein [Modestobacter sp. VKM Ac-2978]